MNSEAESSLGAAEITGSSSPKLPSKSVQTRLHGRVMAAAYKYRLVSPEEDGHTGGQYENFDHGHGGGSYMKWAVAILTCLLLTTTSLLIWQISVSHAKGSHTEPCYSPQCVDVSAYILRKMNLSANPCEDFYSYSCGGWERTTFIPPEKAKFDTFAEVHQSNEAIVKRLLDEKNTIYKGQNSSAIAKLKTFYRSCMDVEQIEKAGSGPILKMIEELGSWSIAPSKSGTSAVSTEVWDLISSLAKFHQFGESPLFSFGLTVDAKNSSRYLLGFSQAGLTLDSKDEYLKDPDGKFRAGFLKFAVGVGELLGGVNAVQQKMEAVYDFEKEMAEIWVPKEKLIDPTSRYNLMSVADFQKLIGPQVDIKRFMSVILNRTVTDTEVVDVITVDYFRVLGSLIEKTSQQLIQDYFVWHMLQQVTGYLPQAFVDYAMVLNEAELGITAVGPRWQRCVSKAESAFGFASSALYVQETFPPESKVEALEILTDVQSAFISILDTVNWMDAETRNAARVKAEAMGKVLGYPDWILDRQQLDAYYENFTVKEGALLENYFDVCRAEVQRSWNKQGKTPDKNEWGMMPDEVNAFFSSTYNNMAVLAGLLQRPYFDRAYPQSFLYGSMGMISGHELTHGFDNAGRRYDKNGNMNDWWTATSAAQFQDRSQCMVDQYSQFEIDGTHFNGQFTLAENIADNAGLKLGYLAYNKKKQSSSQQQKLPGIDLNPDQLFFVGFAQVWCAHYTPAYAQLSILSDEHTNAKYRVLGSVANSAPFSEVFQCPVGSPLNPEHKCSVW